MLESVLDWRKENMATSALKLCVVLLLQLVIVTAASQEYRRKVVPLKNVAYSAKELAKIMKSMKPSLDKAITRPLRQPAHAGKINASKTAKQIVGGSDAADGQFPWHARIVIDNSALCGGSLILDSWILTASHCTADFESFEVVLGSLGQNFDSPGTVRQTTTEKFEHPSYDADTVKNDIALLKLEEAVTLSDTIKLIALPTVEDATKTFEKTAVHISGFGLTSDKSGTSERLKYMEDKVVSNAVCLRAFGKDKVFPSTLCTKVAKKAACQGDSGGPVVYRDNANTWRQLGIVSFGGDAGCLVGPSANARVSSYLAWLTETVGEDVAGTTDADATTKATTTTKAPRCSSLQFRKMEKCCKIERKFVKKSTSTCKGEFNVFKAFALNKYQDKTTNEIDLKDAKLIKGLARDACFVNCYLTEKGVMSSDDGTIDADLLSDLLLMAQTDSTGWETIVPTAAAECNTLISEITDISNFVNGQNNCDGKALLTLQCTIYKSYENCPEIKQDAACLKKSDKLKTCGSSITLFKPST